MKKNILFFILILFIVGISHLLGGIIVYNHMTKDINSVEVKTDTIVTNDTIYIDKPIEKYRYITKVVTDTLHTTDSVEVEVNIPIEEKTFTDDSTYTATISGYKCDLKALEVYPRTYTITKEITQQKRIKQPFGASLQCGYGYGLINKKPDIYVGVGLSYNF